MSHTSIRNVLQCYAAKRAYVKGKYIGLKKASLDLTMEIAQVQVKSDDAGQCNTITS